MVHKYLHYIEMQHQWRLDVDTPIDEAVEGKMKTHAARERDIQEKRSLFLPPVSSSSAREVPLSYLQPQSKFLYPWKCICGRQPQGD